MCVLEFLTNTNTHKHLHTDIPMKLEKKNNQQGPEHVD